MTITNETKERNYNLFIKKLQEVGVENAACLEQYKGKLINATYSLGDNDGNKPMAYDGSLLNIILRTLAPLAKSINEALPEGVRVEYNQLVKVCLLHQISKCLMFEPNDVEWQIKKGLAYKYSKRDYSLKMGMLSLFMIQNCGIKLTEQEIEAIMVMDRSVDDQQVKFFSSPIALVIKQANELTHLVKRVKGNE